MPFAHRRDVHHPELLPLPAAEETGQPSGGFHRYGQCLCMFGV